MGDVRFGLYIDDEYICDVSDVRVTGMGGDGPTATQLDFVMHLDSPDAYDLVHTNVYPVMYQGEPTDLRLGQLFSGRGMFVSTESLPNFEVCARWRGTDDARKMSRPGPAWHAQPDALPRVAVGQVWCMPVTHPTGNAEWFASRKWECTFIRADGKCASFEDTEASGYTVSCELDDDGRFKYSPELCQLVSEAPSGKIRTFIEDKDRRQCVTCEVSWHVGNWGDRCMQCHPLSNEEKSDLMDKKFGDKPNVVPIHSREQAEALLGKGSAMMQHYDEAVREYKPQDWTATIEDRIKELRAGGVLPVTITSTPKRNTFGHPDCEHEWGEWGGMAVKSRVCCKCAAVFVRVDGHMVVETSAGDVLHVRREGEDGRITISDAGNGMTLGLPNEAVYEFPDDVRRDNADTVQRCIAKPPASVTDGFGRRIGPTWERWTRALAGLLETANAQEKPTRITETMVAAVVDEVTEVTK